MQGALCHASLFLGCNRFLLVISTSFFVMFKLSDFRRIFLFNYQFEKSRNLEEIRNRLEGKFNFQNFEDFKELLGYVKGVLVKVHSVYLPEDFKNVAFAIKSVAVQPPMIYFLIFQNNEKGGTIMLLETKNSWYSYEKILLSMRPFCKNAGIKCRYIGCLPLTQNRFSCQ